MVFDLAMVLVLITLGTISLWLSRVSVDGLISKKEYIVFALLCFAAAPYPFAAMWVMHIISEPSESLKYRQIATCSATIALPIVVHVLSLLTKRRARRLGTIYTVSIIFCLMAIFNFHYYSDEISTYSFWLTKQEVKIHKSGFGHTARSIAWIFVFIYCLRILISDYRHQKRFVRPVLIGFTLFVTSVVYDSLWATKVIERPIYPLANFGILALISSLAVGMARRQLIYSDELRDLSVQVDQLVHEKSQPQTLGGEPSTTGDEIDLAATQSSPNGFETRLRSAIEEQLSDPTFKPRQLATIMRLSQGHLNRQAKLLTGLSTTDYILESRLKRAASTAIHKYLYTEI